FNIAKGVTQYRIQQVDLDYRAAYTDVRSVRGEESSSKLLVFPNPSNDGKVKLLFENASALKNVAISDMSGRVVKQYKNVTGESLPIENLHSGMYSIQVTDLSTAVITVEKVLVKKR
ncbi:MAG: T9SS type A sorting domain-containing protein, partial [Bacteroidota bacterium]|nr:T9SS type A sorting domain-containing protein [Bacteroidota bacterium]